MNDKVRDILNRLKQCAETDLYVANKALSKDATENDIELALFLAKTIGIE